MANVSLGGIAVVSLVVLLFIAVPAAVLVAVMRGGAALQRVVTVVTMLVMTATSLVTITQIAMLFNGGSVLLSVPVGAVPVQVPAGVVFDVPPVASFTSANFDQVQVIAQHLSLNTSLLLAAGWLCGALTIIAICVVVLRLTRSLAAEDPFEVGAKALAALGWIVLVGWTASAVLGQFGVAGASWELFWVGGYTSPPSWESSDLASHGWPSAGGGGINLPVEPIGAALLLALLAGVFRHGERLRRDTQGLV